jgi:diguanylate cyclase (GGDEF)-like protein
MRLGAAPPWWVETVSISREAEQMFAVVQALPDPVFVLTESGRYAGVVGGSDPRYYHDGSGLVGKTLAEVLPPAKAEWFLGEIRAVLREGRLRTVEYALGGEDVEGLDLERGPRGPLWFEGRIQPLDAEYGGERAVVWVARNITRRFELEVELRRQSTTDELTGVANRRRLLEELNRHHHLFRRYGQPTSLIMLDVDHFKRVNDQFGHPVGDEVLRHLGAVARAELREVDIFARYGGEEFAVILPNTDIAAAVGVAERLRSRVEASPCRLVDHEIGVTISLGASAFDLTDATGNDVMQRADRALYAAKDAGRNCVASHPC